MVTQGKSRAFYVFVIPATGSLNLSAAAACGEGGRDDPAKALLPHRLHPRRMQPHRHEKLYPTFIDESAQLFDAICVSAGKIGAQVELAPDALCGLVSAKYADLAD
ncbi:MAG: hypothetical protein ACLUI3_04360 [Christensenellales bacterium]